MTVFKCDQCGHVTDRTAAYLSGEISMKRDVTSNRINYGGLHFCTNQCFFDWIEQKQGEIAITEAEQ